MPPKGQARRSARGPKASGGADSSSGPQVGYDDPSTALKPKRGGNGGAKARNGSHQLDEPKSNGRGSKLAAPPSPPEDAIKEEDDDDNGITRCLCDESEAETKDMGFMVQCEKCDVWQHGICMGIAREEDCPEKYFCDECRPDLHKKVLEDLAHRQLVASQKSHKKSKPPASAPTQSRDSHAPGASSSRTSRSMTPAEGLRNPSVGQANVNKFNPKRRSTMNSRDHDESAHLELALALSMKEAQKLGNISHTNNGPTSPSAEPSSAGGAVGEVEVAGIGRKKRKRVTGDFEDDGPRRKRSADSPDSAGSEHADEAGPSFQGRVPPPIRTSSSLKGSPALVGKELSGSGTPLETTGQGPSGLGRGRRGKKEKDVDSNEANTKGPKHPNQYSYREGVLPLGASITGGGASSSKAISNSHSRQSPAKSKTDHHGHSTRKNPPQSSKAANGGKGHGDKDNPGSSPSPVPLSYNVPDHFSHLTPLLPNPTPLGVMVPVRVELIAITAAVAASGGNDSISKGLPAVSDDGDNDTTTVTNGEDPAPMEVDAEASLVQPEASAVLTVPAANSNTSNGFTTRTTRQTERGVKVRWPPKRTTIGEMRRRVRSMMEYVARAQLDAGERERRAGMLKDAHDRAVPTSGFDGEPKKDVELKEALKEALADGLKTKLIEGPPADLVAASMPPDGPSVLSIFRPQLSRNTSTQQSSFSLQPGVPANPSTNQLLDEITRDLIQFQERFGAAREAKVFRERTETRERRARGGVGVAAEAEF